MPNEKGKGRGRGITKSEENPQLGDLGRGPRSEQHEPHYQSSSWRSHDDRHQYGPYGDSTLAGRIPPQNLGTSRGRGRRLNVNIEAPGCGADFQGHAVYGTADPQGYGTTGARLKTGDSVQAYAVSSERKSSEKLNRGHCEPMHHSSRSPAHVQQALKGLSISEEQPSPSAKVTKPNEVSVMQPAANKTHAVSPAGQALVRATRPGHSKAMKRQINLITNLYLIKCNKDVVYHYDVDVVALDGKSQGPYHDKKKPGKEICNKILFQLLQVQKKLQDFKMVYDGNKNMISAKSLPIVGDSQEFFISVPLGGKEKSFTVTIKPVRKSGQQNNAISMSSLESYCFGKSRKVPYDVSMVIELIFNYRRPGYKQANVNNSFFWFSPKQHTSLDETSEIWQGYNQSIRFTERGGAIMINMAHKAFHKSGSVLELISQLLHRQVTPNTKLDFKQKERILKKMKDLRVEVTHQANRRKYRIQGLSLPAAEQPTNMVDNNNQNITVQQYFKTKYNKGLAYPFLPCFHMAGGNNKVFMPMEVCEVIPGQRVKGKLEARSTAKMIKETAVQPAVRFQAIQDSAEEVLNISDPYLKEFGIGMNLEPMKIVGRVIEQPQIQYNSNVAFPNETGTWNVKGRYGESKSALNGVMISFVNNINKGQLDYLADLLCKTGKKYGLDLQFHNIVKYGANASVNQIFIEFIKTKFFVFILPEVDNDYNYYEQVKYFGDLKYSVTTQCVNESVFRKNLDERLASNICLKINTKLGGINHGISEWPLALHKEAVMIFGADVIHDIHSVCPSIAAAVATIDISLFKYGVSCRAQNNPKGSNRSQEIMIYLEEMVKFLLLAYYRNSNKRKPEKLLFYRDGVSEGQFQEVLEKEIPMIKHACRSLQPDYQPKITFVIVQKRHQFRIRPANRKDGVGRAGNVPPGTTIDTDVVDPQGYDFYLCSHEGIQGTSKASHYTVLFDENGVKPEIMEKLTFFMCHLFARCNRSISIPAPVKYADLLAYRANAYLKCRHGKQRKDTDEIPKEVVDLIKGIDSVSNQMFFI